MNTLRLCTPHIAGVKRGAQY